MPPQVTVNKSALVRMSLLLWGAAGCGKTYFANTSEGKRLFLNFDIDGTASLPLSDDTLVLDYAKEPDSCVSQAFLTNPYGLNDILTKDESIRTVIVDSVTAFTTRATAYSVGHKNAPGSVHENPGPAGYGFRNRHALALVRNVLQVTARHNRHVIFIAHEDTPDKDKDGNVVGITIMLGGSLPTEVPLQISEVWQMADMYKSRVVRVRSVGIHKPMKSRLFDTNNGYEFEISTLASPSKVRLDTLQQRWREAKYEKLKLP